MGFSCALHWRKDKVWWWSFTTGSSIKRFVLKRKIKFWWWSFTTESSRRNKVWDVNLPKGLCLVCCFVHVGWIRCWKFWWFVLLFVKFVIVFKRVWLFGGGPDDQASVRQRWVVWPGWAGLWWFPSLLSRFLCWLDSCLSWVFCCCLSF